MGKNGSELKGNAAEKLRAAGYVPLPRWWVKRDEMDAIERIAMNHRDDVNRIRAAANRVDEGGDSW